MQQIYSRNHASAWIFSCKFTAYFLEHLFNEHLWMAASVEAPGNWTKNSD